MPKVRFNLKDSGGLILLKFRYRRGGLPFVYSTGQHVSPDHWDFVRMRAKVTMKTGHHANLNNLLDRLEKITQHTYWQMIADNIQPNKRGLKLSLDAATFKNMPEKVTLLGHWAEVIRDKKSDPGTSGETVANYEGTLIVLKRFNPHLDFDDISFSFLKKFEKWCYTENYSTNTVRKYVAQVKAVVNSARKEGHTNNRTVTERGFMVSPVKSNQLVLYLDELDALSAINWNGVDTFEGMTRQRLEKAADIILAGCWSGLRHSDLKKIRPENIKGGIIEIWTQKTDARVGIPLSPPLNRVLKKHNYFLPTASRGEILRAGRAALKLAGVNTPYQYRDTRGGGLSIQTVPKWSKFSAHDMRRSFATNMYCLGVDTKKIRLITGHATEQMLLNYINIGDWMTAARMEEIERWRYRLGIAG